MQTKIIQYIFSLVIFIFLSPSTPPSNSPFGILYPMYDESKFNSLNAALWMFGDNE